MAYMAICDLCYMEGKEQKAVARYKDAEYQEWVVCASCLDLVKKTGLEWELLGEEELDE